MSTTLVSKLVDTNVWTYPEALDYDKTYYWRVWGDYAKKDSSWSLSQCTRVGC